MPLSTPNDSFAVEIVPSTAQLDPYIESISELNHSAVEPNPFFEPEMLLPALAALNGDSSPSFLLIFRVKSQSMKRQLVAFLPFERAARFKGLPAKHILITSHIYSFLGTPLLLSEDTNLILVALFDWLRKSDNLFIALPLIALDGSFFHALTDVLNDHKLTIYFERFYTRALYRKPTIAAEYLKDISTKTRKHVRRQRELLSEIGEVKFEVLESDASLSRWLAEFLELESSGWKGREGSALASKKSHLNFFLQSTSAAFRRGDLRLSALRLNGTMIAARVLFRAGAGSYLFKIAFDEKYSKLSPGTILEFEEIEKGIQPFEWTDSCTSSKNTVYKRLWHERRVIATLLVSAGTKRSEFVLSLLPILRFAKKLFSLNKRAAPDG